MTSDAPVARACSLAARAADEQPEGWAIVGRRFLLVEVPLPWPARIETAAAFPPGLAELLATRDQHDPYVEAIVPDPEYAAPGRTRVVLFDRPDRAARAFQRTEHLIPIAEVTSLVAAWLDRKATIDAGPTEPSTRDIVVCTHGSHDACCGRFGAPLYRELRDRFGRGDVRIWRGSHTGGHRFAPTLIDLPTGRSWARLEPHQLDTLIDHAESPGTLRGHYRGWAVLPTFYERLVEAELLFGQGWEWLDRHVAGTLVEGHPFVYPEDEDELDDRAVVRLTTSAVDGRPEETWEAVVERGADTVTRGECGEEPWDAPSYRVTALHRLETDPVVAS
jgi:hypothetical protein